MRILDLRILARMWMKMKIKDGNVIGEEGEFEGWDDNLGDAEG